MEREYQVHLNYRSILNHQLVGGITLDCPNAEDFLLKLAIAERLEALVEAIDFWGNNLNNTLQAR